VAGSWQRLCRGWGAAIAPTSGEADESDAALSCEIMLAVGDGAGSEAGYEERLLWCVDAGVELVEVDLDAEQAARHRGLPAVDSHTGEADGVARVAEALQCRPWPRAADEAAGSVAAARVDSCVAAADTNGFVNGDAGFVNGDAGFVNGDGPCDDADETESDDGLGSNRRDRDLDHRNLASRDEAAEVYMQQLVGEEGAGVDGEATAEEREADRLERLMEEMSALRGGVVTNRDERIERAAALAMEMAALLGDGDLEDELGDEESSAAA